MLPYRLAEVERKAESITVTEIVVIVIDIVTARACVVAARLTVYAGGAWVPSGQ